VVGQQLVAQLVNHPWFQLTWIAGSERSEGRRYGELPWRLAGRVPNEIAKRSVERARPGAAPQLVFSALDAAVAAELETAFATAGHAVVSNARNFRMDPAVPLLIPEINPDHLGLVPIQQKRKKWRGAIITNPNCSTVFLSMALAALREFQVKRVLVTTLQAVSGAGYPGVSALDMLGNVLPSIEGEEEKIEAETRKILGRLEGESVMMHPLEISAQATRVPVADGHTEAVSVELEQRVSCEEILEAFREFSGAPQLCGLPSAPDPPLEYHEEVNRPQPRLDAETNGGMAVHIGRLRPCPVLGYKFILLGHNTIRGAAGAALLNAELLAAREMV